MLAAGLAGLTLIFFFQTFATRNERVFSIIRTCFLVFTLVFIGWYANAQLSVVNVLAVISALFSNFRWETFLMDPLIFIMWFAVAAALLLLGARGLLRLALPLRRAAGTVEQDCPPVPCPADHAALGPA